MTIIRFLYSRRNKIFTGKESSRTSSSVTFCVETRDLNAYGFQPLCVTSA